MTTKTGKFESSYGLTAINPDAVEALGIHVVEGSGFSKNAPSDTIEILLGEGVKSTPFRNRAPAAGTARPRTSTG